MPIYEYHCNACNHEYSHLHKRLGEAAPPCPKCASNQVRKMISSFSPGIPAANATACPSADACPAAAAAGHSCCASCKHHA